MENLQENREFSSKDVLGVFGCLLLLALVGLNAVSHAFQDFEGHDARREMARLSHQLMHAGEAQTDEGLEIRAPASLGTQGDLAKDPWGAPYHYRILERGDKVYGIAIWSDGPNQKAEIEDKDFLTTESGRVFRILKAGDDLTHLEMIY